MSEEIMNIGSAEGDQVLELDINRLRAFKNHPFKVTADMSMVELKDSIEKYGILNPLISQGRKPRKQRSDSKEKTEKKAH